MDNKPAETKKKKKWIIPLIIGLVAAAVAVVGTVIVLSAGGLIAFGIFSKNKDSADKQDYEDYKLDLADFKVSVDAKSEDKIDTLTFYGVGNIDDYAFPKTPVKDNHYVKGETVYEWSLFLGEYKLSLYFDYDNKSGNVKDKDYKASIYTKNGKVNSNVKYELIDNAIVFYDITLPDKKNCIDGVSIVGAQCIVGDMSYYANDIPVSVNGKLCSYAPEDVSFTELVNGLNTSEIADNGGNDNGNSGNDNGSNTGNRDDDVNNDGNSNNGNNSEKDEDNNGGSSGSHGHNNHGNIEHQTTVDEAIAEEELKENSDNTMSKNEFYPEDIWSPNGWYIGFIFGTFGATPQGEFDNMFFAENGAPTITLSRDGQYMMRCFSGGDEWVLEGYYTVIDAESEMDDIVVLLHDATNDYGDKVTAQFVFSDAEDYPVFMEDGFGYMGGNGAPYWFERLD